MTLPVAEGEIQILAGHIPLLTRLTGGAVEITMPDGTHEFLALGEGLVQELGEVRAGLRVGTGGVGLLLSGISSSQPFDGYTDPEATEKKIVRDAFTDGDAWFISGDLMLDQGLKHASFVDRLGDTFRWKGENVATTEVEAAVGTYPDVDQAVVYGVAVPGADGKAGMAAVRMHDGAEFDGEGLARHLRETLPSYAVPQFIRLSEELETTSTFKSRKAELREQAFDTSTFDEPVFVLSKKNGYVPFYDGAERDIVAGTA